MQVRFMLAALLVIGLWSPAPVAACSCVMLPVEDSIARHPVIVSGRVTKMELFGPTDMIRIEIAVEQAFKGTSGKAQVVYSRPYAISCYGYNFRVGFRYLIFAGDPESGPELKDLPPGSPLVGTCGGTVELSTADGGRRLKAVQQALQGR